MDVTDRERVDAYRRGDVEAFDSLVEKYRRPLFGFLVNMTGSQVEADDIFQETWFKAIRGIESYKDGNFGGWLCKIARNVIIDRARKRKPDVSLDADPEDGRRLSDQVAGADPGPRARVVDHDLGRAIAAAVENLPEEQKEVFLLRVEADLSFKDIAKIQKVSINTALARMQYALGKLKSLLKDEYKVLTGG